MSALARTQMTPEEYLAWDASHEGKHEYVNGEMWAMAWAQTAHNIVTANLIGVLYGRLRASPCYPLASDMRVLIDETGLYCYPDVTVVCGPPETLPTQPPTLTNPSVVVEVLSESTAAFDKDVKFAHYDGWRLTEARGEETLAVACLGIELPLPEVFARLDVAA
jgi:Uma2 family endonuclease